jgi:hypothetical protein
MEQVIVAKRLRDGDAERQIHEDREDAVVPGLAEREAVAELVDREQERVIDDAAERVAHERNPPPGGIAQRIRSAELGGDECCADVLGVRARPIQALELGMEPEHSAAAFGVQLGRAGPGECVAHPANVARSPHAVDAASRFNSEFSDMNAPSCASPHGSQIAER